MTIWSMTSSLGILFLVLISVAFFSLYERKIMASVQSRMGPDKVLVKGFFQPMADALKLLTKVDTSPENSMELLYTISPWVIMFTSLSVWALFPTEFGFFESKMGAVILLLYFSISVYGLILSGWSSNSRYSTLGAVRAIVQSISFEIGLSLTLVLIMVVCSTTSLLDIMGAQQVSWFSVVFPLIFSVGIVSMYAEVNRSPFDLAEGESELVSGYSVEYGGGKYTTIFLGENIALVWASVCISVIFFGGFGVILFVSLFALVRATVPRVRYDKMMGMFWIFMLPSLIGLGGVAVSLW